MPSMNSSQFARWSKCAASVVLAGTMLTSSCGFKRKKYENPISKDTVQPDKVLFDKAMNEVEHSRYEVARLLLQNLMNTYDTSEFMAKAKLLYADSFYREGGSHGLAQAEAEYKDFILFYPQMEEAAEAQQRVCMIHYKQIDRPDRDPTHIIRAEDECRQLLVQFPNSKAAKSTEQLLRNIQEVRAEGENLVGELYHKKESRAAAAARFQELTDSYPLYSRADDALWNLAADYEGLGNRFRKDQVAALQKLVREYPLSDHADQAKKELARLEAPVPQADPVALARMKYNEENREKRKVYSELVGTIMGGREMKNASKTGAPQMTLPQRSIPVSVPQVAAAAGTNEVVIENGVSAQDLANKPDARMAQPTAASTATGGAAAPSTPNAPAAAGTPAAAGPTAAPTETQNANAAVDPKAKKKKVKKASKPLPPSTAAAAAAANPRAAGTTTSTTTPPPQQ